MAYHLSEPALAPCDIPAKNRVWGFFALSSRTHPANRHQSLQSRRKNRPTATKTVSGIPYWPSRDPIEEAGGVNLYGFVGNDGIQRVDFNGLMTVHYGFITPSSVPIQDGTGDIRTAGLTYWSGDVSCEASGCKIECTVIAASQILMNTASEAKGTKKYNEAVNHEKMHVMSWVKKVKDRVVGPLLSEESDCKNADECSERAQRLQKQYMEILLDLLCSTDHKNESGSTKYSPINGAFYGQITQMGDWENDIDRGKESGSVGEGVLIFKTKK